MTGDAGESESGSRAFIIQLERLLDVGYALCLEAKAVVSTDGGFASGIQGGEPEKEK